MDSIRELYQQMILEHNRLPRNFRLMTNFDASCDGRNPLCGDDVTVYIKIDKSNNVLSDVSFQGSGCAISQSSASMMTMSILYKSIDEVEVLFEEFHHMILGKCSFNDSKNTLKSIKKLQVFEGVRQFPSRTKCASLPWHAMMCAIRRQKIISTE